MCLGRRFVAIGDTEVVGVDDGTIADSLVPGGVGAVVATVNGSFLLLVVLPLFLCLTPSEGFVTIFFKLEDEVVGEFSNGFSVGKTSSEEAAFGSVAAGLFGDCEGAASVIGESLGILGVRLGLWRRLDEWRLCFLLESLLSVGEGKDNVKGGGEGK